MFGKQCWLVSPGLKTNKWVQFKFSHRAKPGIFWKYKSHQIPDVQRQLCSGKPEEGGDLYE